jgi:branched-chain amino acid transport system substrate-binding protein
LATGTQKSSNSTINGIGGSNGNATTGTATPGSGTGTKSAGHNGSATNTTIPSVNTGGLSGCTAQATGTPIVVGFIGDLSGFGASTSVPSEELWTGWTRYVNSVGGINCHPVNLLVGDDGGSTTADASLAQQFVGSEGAVALTWASTDPSAIGSYAQAHSVPVIGTETGGSQWETDSMLFAPGGTEEAGSYGSALAAKRDGATKLGILYCVESPAVCSSTAQKFATDAQQVGASVVYSGAISLTQPDYTANCLQARDKGVQLLYVLGDTNTEIRVAQSCARQDWNPIYMLPEAEDSFGSVPQLNNAINANTTFPWMIRSGSPALDLYGHILQTYAPDLASNGQGTQTWGYVSAVLFGEAARAGTAGLKPTDKVTSQDILNGLWSIKNDTLGGLDPGPMARSFYKGKVTLPAVCVMVSKLEGGHWAPSNGLTPLCKQ